MNQMTPTSEQRRQQRRQRLARHKPKLLAMALLTLLLAGAALWLPEAQLPHGTGEEAPVLKVSSVLVRPGTVGQSLFISGSVVPREEIAIGTALQEQRVASVRVEEGDQVMAGQILAQLETSTLDAQVQQAEATVQRTAALIRQHRALNAEARSSQGRIDQLGSIGAASAQQVDQQRAQARSAEANLAAARAEHEQALAQLADARAQQQKAVVRAPVAGVISERHARIGALSASEPLFRLIRDNQLELDGEVTQKGLFLLDVGTQIQVQAAGVAEPVIGTVRLLAPKVDPLSRRARVRIALAAAPGLRAGSFATASLELPHQASSLVLPQRALTFVSDQQASVMVLGLDGKASLRQVRVGRRDGIQVELLSGLAEGERVVAQASAFVREGDVVSLGDDQPQATP
ncbi:efflux RND transporter periplasmic adaptor subunit [Pseudomonas sp. L5B5]|uniref:efflux RND transporter periplasmic adaptor subunit n=1 Tax=Pseudomonas sp. L5B5 TaxID=2883205 RepID=UPI001CF93E39|nr:efflux RND transporter periplasmic adaptor subunit [Pseudomonas sp. L5B5]UCZ86319.1 efflux RND transporter periplasmic adaptor subunit [Pseudomonas sp. L5B5]